MHLNAQSSTVLCRSYLVAVLQFVQHDDRSAVLGIDLLPESTEIVACRCSGHYEAVLVPVALEQPNQLIINYINEF